MQWILTGLIRGSLNGGKVAGDEGIHEAVPRGEDDVGGDSADILEEPGVGCFRLPGLLPERF